MSFAESNKLFETWLRGQCPVVEADLALIHAANDADRLAISKDLAGRPDDWLHSAAKAAAADVTKDFAHGRTELLAPPNECLPKLSPPKCCLRRGTDDAWRSETHRLRRARALRSLCKDACPYR
jgi:hypothetical protein